MRVSEICSRTVSYVRRDTAVLEAARRMREDHVGDLIVVDDAPSDEQGEHEGEVVPVGVLTDRDVVVGVLAQDAEHVQTLDVGDVIAPEGTLVSATEEEDLRPVLHRMRSFGVRRLPVVDERGVLAGVLSVDDVIAALVDELSEVAALVTRQATRESARRP
jgi:CBS domain-containing protein